MAWDDDKGSGDIIYSDDWDAMVADQKSRIHKDGSVALTADWDIGDGRKLLMDGIRARDAAGLELYDDGGNGAFVADGGFFGVLTNAPDRPVEIVHAAQPQWRIAHTHGSIYAEFQSESDGDLTIALTGSNVIITDKNFELGTTTGTMFGTGTSQKIAFYGSTPVVQSVGYSISNVTPDRSYDADGTSVAELADALGTVIADLQALGLLG